MAYFKRFFGRLFGLLIFNGALYAIVKIVIYIVGVLYWQGLLNMLGIDYSFVRLDDYNLYTDGAILSLNSSFKVIVYICLFGYCTAIFLFLFADMFYWIQGKVTPWFADEKFRFKVKILFVFFIIILIALVVLYTGKIIVGSYQKGKEDALAIINNQQLTTSDNKDKEVFDIKKTIQLKTGKVLTGTLVGCSQDQCIIYSQNKAFTIEKDKIESLVSEFELKK